MAYIIQRDATHVVQAAADRAREDGALDWAEALECAVERLEMLPLHAVEPIVYAHWIANNICSHCKKSIFGYAIQQGYDRCPYCGAHMVPYERPKDKPNDTQGGETSDAH